MANLFAQPVEAREIIRNPSWETLRKWATMEETTTSFGSARYITRIRSRSARFTDILFDEPSPEQRQWLEEVQATLRTERLIQLDRRMGDHPDFRLHCRLYVPVDFARLAFMWGQSLFDAPPEWAPAGACRPDDGLYPKWRGKTMERHVLVDRRPYHLRAGPTTWAR